MEVVHYRRGPGRPGPVSAAGLAFARAGVPGPPHGARPEARPASLAPCRQVFPAGRGRRGGRTVTGALNGPRLGPDTARVWQWPAEDIKTGDAAV